MKFTVAHLELLEACVDVQQVGKKPNLWVFLKIGRRTRLCDQFQKKKA